MPTNIPKKTIQIKTHNISNWTEHNYKELADAIEQRSFELDLKLFLSPLLGSGIAIIALLSIISNSSTQENIQHLLLISVFCFSCCLISSYLSGVFLSVKLMAEVNKLKEFSNQQDMEKAVYDTLVEIGHFQNLNDNSKDIICNQRYKALEHKSKGLRQLLVQSKANTTSDIFTVISLIFFSFGLLTPLTSVFLYDYF